MIDSHAHVAFYQFDEDRDRVMTRAREAGVKWIEVGTDLEQSKKAVELAQNHDGVWATVGVHPSDVAAGVEWQEVERLLRKPKVVAVGEVGIDLYHQENVEEQLKALKRFVELARRTDLPVIFHVRDPSTGSTSSPQASSEQAANAHDQMIKFLREQNWNRGVIHTFSGTKVQAQQYLEMGLYLSFSGVVTFKNAGEIAEVARTMPLESMLIETDCPFLAPEPYRGRRNEPAYVRFVAAKIAELRGVDRFEIERTTEENIRRLFDIADGKG